MTEETNIYECIYLLHEREFISKNINIYKIGRTSQPLLTRFNQYPKGSKLLYQRDCYNSIKIELEIINFFKNKYIHAPDIGNEYFRGNYNEMIDDINIIIKKETDNKCTNRDKIDKLIDLYFKDISDDDKKIVIFVLENNKVTENNIIELIHIKYKNEVFFVNNNWEQKEDIYNIKINYDKFIILIKSKFVNIFLEISGVLSEKSMNALNCKKIDIFKDLFEKSILFTKYADKTCCFNYSLIKIKHTLEKKFIKIS